MKRLALVVTLLVGSCAMKAARAPTVPRHDPAQRFIVPFLEDDAQVCVLLDQPIENLAHGRCMDAATLRKLFDSLAGA